MVKMRTVDMLSSKNSVANTFLKAEISHIAMKLMIRRELGALLVTCLLFSMAAGQTSNLEQWTLEQVLDKVAEANGGKDTINNLTNVRMSGYVEGDANSYDFVLLKKRPDKIRMRFMFKGSAIENGFDGIVGWRRQSRGDQSRIVELDTEQLAAIRLESDFDGPLIGEAQGGLTRKLERIERIGRVDYFVIRTQTTARSADHYIDSRTFREFKLVSRYKAEDGKEQVSESIYHEYKKHGGIWVPHLVERILPNGSLEKIYIEKVEVNPGILDLVFKKPE